MLTFSLNQADEKARKAVANIDFKLRDENRELRLNTNKVCEWAGTIFENALKGGVSKDTDVAKYASGCAKNEIMNKSKKEVNALSVEELKENAICGVSEVVFNYTHDYLEEIIESDEVRYAVAQFIDMRDYLYIEEGIDIWVLLKKLYDSASTQRTLSKTVVEKFQYIMTEYHMKDILLVLAKHKECRNVLEGVLC